MRMRKRQLLFGVSEFMNFKGVIIEESLADKTVLQKVKILRTEVEKVTARHKTPWLQEWTLHTFEIPGDRADQIAHHLSLSLEKNWYADYKNEKFHYIVYRGKIFKVDVPHPVLYRDAKHYGISLGIPAYQVDFSPDEKIR